MLRNFLDYLEVSALKEDLRKIGFGCITAGLVAIFITNNGHPLLWSVLLIMLGSFFWISGLIKGELR